MKLKCFSHSSLQISTENGQVLLIGPFPAENPTSFISSNDMSANDIIHDHSDHIGDFFKITRGTPPLFIYVNELFHYCIEKGFKAQILSYGNRKSTVVRNDRCST